MIKLKGFGTFFNSKKYIYKNCKFYILMLYGPFSFIEQLWLKNYEKNGNYPMPVNHKWNYIQPIST